MTAIWKDDDLKTPQHDAIMLWLDENIQSIVNDKLGFLKSWTQEEIEWCKKVIDIRFPIPDREPPPKPEIVIETQIWEYPICTYLDSNCIVGFADMRIVIRVPYLGITTVLIDPKSFEGTTFYPTLSDFKNDWEILFRQEWIIFEVKSSIPSLGEVIRQIRKYEKYLTKAIFVVVCPDDLFEQKLSDQGIKFVKCSFM